MSFKEVSVVTGIKRLDDADPQFCYMAKAARELSRAAPNGSSLGNLSPFMLAHGRGCYLLYEARERVKPALGTYSLRRCLGRATFLRRSRFSS